MHPHPADLDPGALERTAGPEDLHAGSEHATVRPPSRRRGVVRIQRVEPRVLLAAAVVVVFVVAMFGRQYLARPESLDERMPIASEEAPNSSSSGASSGASSATGAVGGSTAVTTAGSGPVFVHVAGAVAAPGVVQLGPGSRVVDAVAAAGGLRVDADPDRVNLAAPLVDGSRVVVPALGQQAPSEMVSIAPTGAGGSSVAPSSATPVELNSATLDQLDELPGVGPATAQAILAHRQADGPFTSVEGLLDVRGIGEAKLDAMRELVTVG